MTISRYRYFLAVLMFLVRACASFIMLVPALYMAEIAVDFNIPPELTGTYVGLYVGLIMWGCAIFVLFSGPIVNKIGAKRCGFIGAALLFMGTLLTALNPFGFLAACIFRFIFGVGLVLVVVGFAPITQTWFTSEEYGRINGILETCTSVGIMLNFAITPRLFESYRHAHFLYSIPMAIFAVLWGIFGRNPLVSSPKSEESYFRILKTRLREIIKIKEVFLMFVVMWIAMGVGTALTSWIPSYFATDWRWRPEIASLLVTIYNLTNILSWPLGGTLSDKVGLRRPFLIVGGFGIFISAFNTITFVGPASWFWYSLVGLFAAVYGFSIMTIPMEHPKITPELISTAVSVILLGGFLGGAIMPMVLGLTLDLTGSLYTGIITVSTLYIVISIIGLIVRETGWKATATVKT